MCIRDREILRGIKERYEQHHKVVITEEAIQAAADLSVRYITDRHLPDKAIDLIDEAAARVRLRYSSAPPPVREAQKELERVVRDREAAINAQEHEEAAALREREAEVKAQVDELRKEWQDSVAAAQPTVDGEEIAEIHGARTGIFKGIAYPDYPRRSANAVGGRMNE